METVSRTYVVLTTKSGVTWNTSFESEANAYKAAQSLLVTMRGEKHQRDVCACHEDRLVIEPEGTEELSVPVFFCRTEDLECVAARTMTHKAPSNKYGLDLFPDEEDDDDDEE